MWEIKDLDKSKTEQCINSEQIRLDNCRKELDRLKKNYDRKKYEYMNHLSNIEDKMTELETSINYGEEFVRKCNEHLILDFNDETKN